MFEKVGLKMKRFFMISMVLMSCLASAFATDVTFNTSGINEIEVYDNTTLLGTINDSGILNLSDEAQNLTFVKEYFDNTTIEVNPLTATEYNVTLNETEYTVVINSDLDSFEIYDNGTYLGNFSEDARVLELTYGTYLLTFSKTGYEIANLTLDVPETLVFDVNLTQIVVNDTEDETNTTTTTEETGDIPFAIIVYEGDTVSEKLESFFLNNFYLIGAFVFIVILGIFSGAPKTVLKKVNGNSRPSGRKGNRR